VIQFYTHDALAMPGRAVSLLTAEVTPGEPFIADRRRRRSVTTSRARTRGGAINV
jgi:hypothetical protein